MFPRRRIIPLLLAGALLFAIRLILVQHGVSLFSGGSKNKIILPDLRQKLPVSQPWKDVFPVGAPKSADYQYTRTIVMASMNNDNTSWIDDELGDLLAPHGPFKKAIYVADDRMAPLHPIKNKGHEAMIYLTYIIENYERLPDISIFIHSDRWAWHNNELMENDLAGMIRYLNPAKVIRDGYMNLRCHWDPGCPNWLYLVDEALQDNIQKQEERAIAEHWHELFPMDQMPDILSQPCCAQFALSRERMLAIPKQRYMFLKSWILRTPLDDYRSGRVFEYLWQFIFTGNAEVCPAMNACYCDGYGLCFGGAKEFDAWFELRYKKVQYESQIRRMKEGPKEGPKDGMKDGKDRKDRKEDGRTNRPGSGSNDANSRSGQRMEELQQRVVEMKAQLKKLKDEAFLRGGSDQARAREAGRE